MKKQLELMNARSRENLPITLRPATAGDELLLQRIYASTREEELAFVDWDDAKKEAFVRMQFEAQNLDYTTNYPNAEYSIVLLDGEPAGRVWIDRTNREIHLLDIAVLPAFRNRGIGTVLLRSLRAEAEETGVPLRHMVFATNSNALRFYERLGFAVVDEQPPYYQMEIVPGPSK